MSTKILINATFPEEVRVAIQKNNELFNYDNDRLDNINKKGCVFKGKVSRVEPSLDAAFIDFGRAKHGFLPLSEVMRSHPRLDSASANSDDKPGIGSYLKEGQDIIVQVEKDERGTKGAALTTNISLAGCFVVLMPNTAGAGGISRQIEGEDREQLKRILNQIDIHPGHSLILRTASVNKTLEELLWDYNVLVSHWNAIVQVAQEAEKPLLLFKEGALLQRTIRDYLKPDVESILVDDKSTYEEVLALVQHARPDFLDKVKLYEDTKTTLFDAHNLEFSVESLYNSEISLSNGATLVIDHCEALTAIDINSAKATNQADIEETAFNINKAAAYEIARQIRLRNLGGQIVIDFIDMAVAEHRREVEKTFKRAIEQDKARIQLGSLCDKLGLLALSRQRLNTSLDESSLVKCQHCHGHGVHRRAVPVALSAIRLLRSQARSHGQQAKSIVVKTNANIAQLLYNTYRSAISAVEQEYSLKVVLQLEKDFGAADFEIEVQRQSSVPRVYRNFDKVILEKQEEAVLVPAVKPSAPLKKGATRDLEPEKSTLLSKIYNAFFGIGSDEKSPEKPDESSPKKHFHRRQRRHSGRRPNQSKNPQREEHNQTSQDKAPVAQEEKHTASPGNEQESRPQNQRRRRSSSNNRRRSTNSSANSNSNKQVNAENKD